MVDVPHSSADSYSAAPKKAVGDPELSVIKPSQAQVLAQVTSQAVDQKIAAKELDAGTALMPDAKATLADDFDVAAAPAAPVLEKSDPAAVPAVQGADDFDVAPVPAAKVQPDVAGGNEASVDIQSLLKGERQAVVGEKQAVVGERQTVLGENLVAIKSRNEFSAQVDKTLAFLDEGSQKRVTEGVANLQKNHPEALKGVAPSQIMSAYLVANAADLGVKDPAQRAQFEASLGGLRESGDKAFFDLVKNLSAEDAKVVTDAREKALSEHKVVVVDGRQMIILDAKNPDAPADRYGKRADNTLAHRVGDLAVVPPSEVVQADCLKKVSSFVSGFPLNRIPESIYRNIIAASRAPAVRTQFGVPGGARGEFNFANGLDAHNRAFLLQAAERLLGHKLFADADHGNAAPALAPGVTVDTLTNAWASFRNNAGMALHASLVGILGKGPLSKDNVGDKKAASVHGGVVSALGTDV